MPSNRFHVPKICTDCPFRRESTVRLSAARIVEIANIVAPEDGKGGGFFCHNTTGVKGGTKKTNQQCAGALTFAFKQDITTNVTRVAIRLDGIDPALRTDPKNEIFGDVDEMLEHSFESDYSALHKRKRRKRRP